MNELESTLSQTSPDVRCILEGVLSDRPLSIEDAVSLCDARGPDLRALIGTADTLRREQAGDRVGYVVNRNINFTNLCVKSCKFCAFSRTARSEERYYLEEEEIVRRARQAHELGATEVCIQAGLPPSPKPTLYLDLLNALKRALPDLHVHAFSPEEVKYGAELMGVSLREYLQALKAAGIGSLPGTSAEILDDAVRKRLAGGRIKTGEWLDVIRTAHEVGIKTTATIMYGHIETDLERMRHLDLLRSLQLETGGFSEFVPLSFVHAEAPLHFKQMLPDVRPGPTGNDVMRLIAISRLMLGPSFKNIQTSWVKEGIRQAQWLLDCGANDLGGTLMNESISTSAGAQHGQLMRPSDLRRAIRDAGRIPFERSTLYEVRRSFPIDPAEDPAHPLDAVHNAEEVFGSYLELTRKARAARAGSALPNA
ncbi:MAG TPA: 5-amino-6-(D-ribitylamino)uracil--L-tyrosine 4-hydroxyphenyl transferase CofH [Polyangiales bacterium]|nr:5-amino-6-(D-ribitylamino)uracil--L-tyrosine 4-hydroxyphenyl transferase CofH [Polyangiales bacterium]